MNAADTPRDPAPVDLAAQAGLETRVQRTAQALNVVLDDRQVQQLIDYLALLQRWNAVYNLTAVRDPGQMLVQHLADSLAIVPSLRRHAAGRGLSVLDVGSGGGLPGVVVAIACPEMKVCCIDAVAKKARFVQQVAAEMQLLLRLQSLHGRVEATASRRFDLITSRAFASLADFTVLTRALLAPEGVWLAMKGKRPSDEIAALPADIEVFHVEPIQVPGLDAQRCLVWMRPRQS